MRPRGANVMGRNIFGPIRGEWDEEWCGWWAQLPRNQNPFPPAGRSSVTCGRARE